MLQMFWLIKEGFIYVHTYCEANSLNEHMRFFKFAQINFWRKLKRSFVSGK
jgi:hypothetical protein